MSNKKVGNDFEKEVAELLNKNGFWVKRIPDNENGQPFDIIAVRNDIAYAFECKVCNTAFFDVSRIELNQKLAYRRWIKAGNNQHYFVFKHCDNIYIRPTRILFEALEKEKRLNIKVWISFRSWLQ